MTTIKLTKMQGCGNDFVIIDYAEYEKTNMPMSELAKKVCDRNFGVGADGMIIPRLTEEQRAGGQEGKLLTVESGKLKVESLSSHAPSPDGERICGRTERSESGLRKDGAYCGEATNAELLEQRANSRQGWDGVISIDNREISQEQQSDMVLLPYRPIALSPSVVGILNLTPDSFSDGGMYNDFESAKNHLDEMIKDGADIIDIGAESTKPYSSPVSAEEQLKKLLPIIEFAKDKIPLSIDTRSAKVAQECLKAGASIINDVSGLCYDEKMIDVISEYNCPVVIQHSKGTPENMQENPQYDDVIEEIYLDLYKKCKLAKSKGIENIIIDPGIGFGKTRENNFEIIRRVEEFKGLGYPVMLGISRKSFLQSDNNEERDILTTALNALAIERKVDFLRVHNVKMHRGLVDLMKMFMVE